MHQPEIETPTTRTTGSMKVTVKSDLEIELERAFDGPRALVFEAHSKPEHVRRWWGSRGSEMIECRMDFRPGGKYRYVVREADGTVHAFRGEYLEIDPPERWVQTFEYEGLPGAVVVETSTLVERDGRTVLTSVSRFDSVEARDGMLESGMEAGAAETWDRLAEHLSRRTGEGSPTAAADAALAAGGSFLVLFALLHVVRRDLDPSWRPISEYALGGTGWLMTAAFLLWSASAVLLFWALRPHVSTLGGRIGLGFLLVGAAGPLLAALFPMDPLGAEGRSAAGALHELGAVLSDGVPIAAALLTWGLVRHNPAWSAARRPLVTTALLAWVGVVLFSVMLAVLLPRHGGHLGPEVTVGWPARLMITAYVLWIVTAAWHARRLGQRRRLAPRGETGIRG